MTGGLAAAALLLSACSSEQLARTEAGVRNVLQAHQLTAEQVQEAIEANAVWLMTWSDGRGGLLLFQSGNTVTIRIGNTSDSGPWRFQGRDFCATWHNLADGERCFRAYTRMWGEGLKLYRSDGTLAGSTTRAEG